MCNNKIYRTGLDLSFFMIFLKISNKIGRAWCKHHFACDYAPLCQIVGHLNNARWINGLQVANWGWGTRSTHIVVPQLWEWIGRERLFMHIYYFSWTVLGTVMPYISEWFQKILSNFELAMYFGMFGQTTVDQSFWIVYETFRLV